MISGGTVSPGFWPGGFLLSLALGFVAKRWVYQTDKIDKISLDVSQRGGV